MEAVGRWSVGRITCNVSCCPQHNTRNNIVYVNVSGKAHREIDSTLCVSHSGDRRDDRRLQHSINAYLLLGLLETEREKDERSQRRD